MEPDTSPVPRRPHLWPQATPRHLTLASTAGWSGIDTAWLQKWCAYTDQAHLMVSGSEALHAPVRARSLTVFTDASVEVNPSRPAVSSASIVVPELGLCVAFVLPRSVRGGRNPDAAEAAAMCAAVDLLGCLGVPLLVLTDSRAAGRWWAGRKVSGWDSLPVELVRRRVSLHRRHRAQVSPGGVRGHNGTAGNELADAAAKPVMRVTRDQDPAPKAHARLQGLAASVTAACSGGPNGTRSLQMPAA